MIYGLAIFLGAAETSLGQPAHGVHIKAAGHADFRMG